MFYFLVFTVTLNSDLFRSLNLNKISNLCLFRGTYLTGWLIYILLVKSRFTSLRNFWTSWTEVTLSALKSIWIFHFLSRRTEIARITLVCWFCISNSFAVISTCAVNTVFYLLISSGIWVSTLWTGYMSAAASDTVRACWTLTSSDVICGSGCSWTFNTVITSCTVIWWCWKCFTATILFLWTQKWLWASLWTVGSIETLTTLGDRFCRSCTSTTKISRVTGTSHIGETCNQNISDTNHQSRIAVYCRLFYPLAFCYVSHIFTSICLLHTLIDLPMIIGLIHWKWLS